MISKIQEFLIWLVWDGPKLGPLAPWVFGLAIGRWPHKVEDKDDKTG